MEKLDTHIQTFRINSEIKRRAQKIADKNKRKLNNWILLLVEEKVLEEESKEREMLK